MESTPPTLMTDEKLRQEKDNHHLVLITNLSRFTKTLNSKHKGSSTGFICRNCLHFFNTKALYRFHRRLCNKIDKGVMPQKTVMPQKGSVMKFNAQNRSFCLSYTASADFETRPSMNQGVQSYPEVPLTPSQDKRYPWVRFPSQQKHALKCLQCTMTVPCHNIHMKTSKLCHMTCFSWAYKIHSHSGTDHFPLRISQEPNSASTFLYQLKQDSKLLYKKIRQNFPLVMNEETQKIFDATDECQLCKVKFSEMKDSSRKCRDHDHQQNVSCEGGSNFRMALCSSCNLAYHGSAINVFLHNLAGSLRPLRPRYVLVIPVTSHYAPVTSSLHPLRPRYTRYVLVTPRYILVTPPLRPVTPPLRSRYISLHPVTLYHYY